MLATMFKEIFGSVPHCECKRPAAIEMHGYAHKDQSIFLCSDCALQLVRKITEDLCELLTRGGRRG
jgi:hypothetical protein